MQGFKSPQVLPYLFLQPLYTTQGPWSEPFWTTANKHPLSPSYQTGQFLLSCVPSNVFPTQVTFAKRH